MRAPDQYPNTHPYIVLIRYPFSWAGDSFYRFETSEEAREYAEHFASQSGGGGTENYIEISLATATEQIN